MIRPVVRWIAVVDARRARIFSTSGAGKELELEREFTHAILPARDINSDRPGRTKDSAAQGRHALEPTTDLVREQKRKFAREVIRFLEAGRRRGAFARLYLIAPPQMLGELRQETSAELRQLIAGELDRDYTNMPQGELMRSLGAVAPV